MIWIVSLLILFGGFFSLYALIGLIPAITIERFFAHEEKEMYLTLAAIVLALEMLATDFAGLADRYPEGHNEAILAFSGLNSDEKTRLLEKYFPGRDEVAPEALEAFAVVD